MTLMNRLNERAVASLGAGRYDDGAGLLQEVFCVICRWEH